MVNVRGRPDKQDGGEILRQHLHRYRPTRPQPRLRLRTFWTLRVQRRQVPQAMEHRQQSAAICKGCEQALHPDPLHQVRQPGQPLGVRQPGRVGIAARIHCRREMDRSPSRRTHLRRPLHGRNAMLVLRLTRTAVVRQLPPRIPRILLLRHHGRQALYLQHVHQRRRSNHRTRIRALHS